ncbi:MAG: hypothetical protein M1828_000296 [Chrysothrix sp. TS-e1954]|nr:MAG: hypothetical protein M1828_000296 [Chrysothrix sp. TS-e1954]
MPTDVPNNIILYHYSFSPYARRIVWYLTLRGIPYAECIQPHILPRPDLQRLGIHYRRIPLLSHGRSVFADTRLILQKLESLFPADGSSSTFSSGSTSPSFDAVRRLLEHWIVDGGIFNRASQLMPATGAITKDVKFLRDRSELTGREWSAESFQRQRPEALVYMRDGFDLLESLLADGREWILETKAPSLADIEAIWPFDWLMGMKGALPEDIISERQYPKVWAWVARFRAAVKAAKKPDLCKRIKGDEAIEHVLSQTSNAGHRLAVDDHDPLQLKKGDMVKVYPIDSGSRHKDVGKLVKLASDEVVIKIETPRSEEIYFHAPRWGYRIQKVEHDAKL